MMPCQAPAPEPATALFCAFHGFNFHCDTLDTIIQYMHALLSLLGAVGGLLRGKPPSVTSSFSTKSVPWQ